ncbi:hypothetical protein JTB14_032116 [Gonioctena quinquepunctata]|nr:hypothetical protein JTB14_032116 [Gonioctena quinquepunctata]
MGSTCTAKLCYNKTYNCKKRFFRFPPDVARARTWAISCGREDLLEKSAVLHKSYRLCQDHFDQKMFTNVHQVRLNPNAVPTLFPAPEGSSRRPFLLDHSYTPAYNVSNLEKEEQQSVSKINVLHEIVISSDNETVKDSDSSPPSKIARLDEATSDTTVKENIYIVFSPEEESASGTEALDVCTPFTDLSPRDCDSPTDSVEPPVILSSDTPQKIKLKNDFRDLLNEYYRLKRRLKASEANLQETKEEFLEKIGLDDYMDLTFKFCRGNIELAHFINVQMSDLASEDE